MEKSRLPLSNILPAAVKRRHFLAVFIMVAILTMLLAACDKDAKKGGDAPTANFTKLTFVSDSVAHDYQKQELANNQSINQPVYALYEAGSLVFEKDGSFAFSGSGPGYSLKTSGEAASEITEKPMSVQLTGKIDRQALEAAIKEGKKSSVNIGSGSYQQSTSGTKKHLFARGNYELTEYNEKGACPLEIVYNADSGRIVCNSREDLDAPRIGKTTSVYDGSTTESDYHEDNKTLVRFEFIPE